MNASPSGARCGPEISSAIEGEELRLHEAAAQLQEMAFRLQAIGNIRWESPAARRFRDCLTLRKAGVDDAIRLVEEAAVSAGIHAAATARLETVPR